MLELKTHGGTQETEQFTKAQETQQNTEDTVKYMEG